MELPEGIEWPASVIKYGKTWPRTYVVPGGPMNFSIEEYDANLRTTNAAISDLIDMVRRFYWQRNELLRLSTAYPAVMKEKLEADWEKRNA